MKDAQPPPAQMRSAPHKSAVAAPTAPAAAAPPKSAIAAKTTPAAAPPPAAAVMPRPQVDMARSFADQPLSMEPLASADNDPSLVVEWRPIQLGAQCTLGCGIQAPAGHGLRVLIEQGVYRKTLSGTESIDISAVPVAAAGTEGTLSIQDETGGASATFTWTWHPPGMRSVSRTAKAQTVPQAKQAKKVPAAAAAARAATNAAATVFFGQPAQGQRIAFILDMSGSMAGLRWERCLRELTAALQALSGRGEFFVVLFSDHLAEPPGQLDWMRAHPAVIQGVIDWMTAVVPTGGTMPGPAFERVFALSARPAAIYFLTDGIFADCTAEDVARLNGSGTLSKLGAFAAGVGRSLFGKSKDDAPAVINTIALDDAGSAPMLQKIAADSGGDYAHASSG